MKLISHIKKFAQTIFITLLVITFGCVESVTDTETSTTPSIEIDSPVTDDTVKVGENTITYEAVDGSDGEGLSYYELYVNKTYVKKYTQNTDGTNPTIYLEVDSTLIHTRINYSLKVYNTVGKSKESTLQENIYVMDTLAIAPSNLLLSRVNDYSVILKWSDNSNNETGFELWRRDLGNGTVVDYTKIQTLSVNTISTTDGNLSPYVDYYYKVRAVNESGYSDFSNEINTGSLSDGAWDLQAEAIGSSSVELTWIDFAVNEQGFQIERTDASGSTFNVLAIKGSNVTEYTDYSVAASSSYKYRVAYFTQTVQSGYSNEASISTYYTDVSAPTDLSDTLLTGPAVQLTWTDNSNSLSEGTVVERKVGTNGQYTEIGTADSDVNEFTDQTISSGTTYFYRVRQKLDNKVYTPYSDILQVDVP